MKNDFKPDVPAPLLINATPAERWMYEQQSVQRQQNDAIIERLDAGEMRFDKGDREREAMSRQIEDVAGRVAVFEKFKERISAKGAVIVFIVSGLIGPIILAFLGAAFIRWFERVWK